VRFSLGLVEVTRAPSADTGAAGYRRTYRPPHFKAKRAGGLGPLHTFQASRFPLPGSPETIKRILDALRRVRFATREKPGQTSRLDEWSNLRLRFHKGYPKGSKLPACRNKQTHARTGLRLPYPRAAAQLRERCAANSGQRTSPCDTVAVSPRGSQSGLKGSPEQSCATRFEPATLTLARFSEGIPRPAPLGISPAQRHFFDCHSYRKFVVGCLDRVGFMWDWRRVGL
jgi:hypothetical protein